MATAVLCVSAGARAADDPMAVYYGNTVHETRSNGTESWFHFAADHSFSGTGSGGRTMTGSYTYDAATGKSCLQLPHMPLGRPAPCAVMTAKKVGDSWDRVGPTGLKEHYVLEAGKTGPLPK